MKRLLVFFAAMICVAAVVWSFALAQQRDFCEALAAAGEDDQPQAPAEAQAQAQEQPEKSVGGQPVERWLPDSRPRPWPDRRPDRRPDDRPDDRRDRTIYGARMLLDGPGARIILDASGRQPSIILESKQTGERALLYLTSKGQAVVGVQTRARKQLMVGMYGEGRYGMLQVVLPWGIHVLDGEELSGGKKGAGSLPKK